MVTFYIRYELAGMNFNRLDLPGPLRAHCGLSGDNGNALKEATTHLDDLVRALCASCQFPYYFPPSQD